jgi:hypothetical protein
MIRTVKSTQIQYSQIGIAELQRPHLAPRFGRNACASGAVAVPSLQVGIEGARCSTGGCEKASCLWNSATAARDNHG